VTRKKVAVAGKHAGSISCGAWSSDNRLALGSDDKSLTLTDQRGDTLAQHELKDRPREVRFSPDGGGRGRGAADPGLSCGVSALRRETTPFSLHDWKGMLSVNLNGFSLLLYDMNDRENPLELAFQSRYGSIVTHRWIGDGYLLLGFMNGFLVVVSTRQSEIGEEIASAQLHAQSVSDLAGCLPHTHTHATPPPPSLSLAVYP